jgi:putative flippase GtrA
MDRGRLKDEGLVARLMSLRVAAIFARNTVVSCAVFTLDLAILWAFIQLLGMQRLLAVAIAFLIANTIHYALGRLWIFRGTTRAVASGYAYFIINAGVGLVLTVALFAVFFDLAGMHFIVARIVASIFAGLAVFLLNAILNFKSV